MSTQTDSSSSAAQTSTPITAPEGAVRWIIDSAHSIAHFSVRHMMVSNVRGQFSGVGGTVLIAPDLKQFQVEATIDATTVDTREAKRDAHLRSPDFFEVEKYPTMSFSSKRVEQIDGESFKLHGDLTLHGVTREVVLDVTLSEGEHKDPWGTIKRGAQATTKLNRKDFDLGFNVALETGGVLVGETVTVELELELNKA